MTNAREITSEYLTSHPRSAAFLDSRRRFTSELGRQFDYESRMVEADADPNRSLPAFRGIISLNPSPFGTTPLKDFRGVLKTPFDGLTNPDVRVDDSAFDNRYRITPQTPDFGEDDFRKAENPDYGKTEDWVYLQQHPQTADLLAENSDLRESYLSDSRPSDFQLEQQTAQTARQRLDFYSPLDNEYLAAHPEEAQILGLNIGGAADVINDDPELARGLTAPPRANYSADIRDELASDTSAQFAASTGLDEQFFRDNPEAAVYLRNHPGMIEKFNQRPEEAQDFRQHYGVMKEQIRDEVIGAAADSLAGQGMFVDDYLQNNPEFAVDIAADDKIKTQGSLRENLLLDDTLEDKNTFTEQIYEEHSAARAETALDGALNREVLEKHPELAYTIQKSPSLAQGLKSDLIDLNRFLGESEIPAAGLKNFRGAMNSFAAGYPFRDDTVIDLWG